MIIANYRKLIFTMLGTCVILLVLINGVPIPSYHDDKVSAGQIMRPWNLVFPHLSVPVYLKVAGRTYRGVRGSPPYYLKVPGTNTILFVTESGRLDNVVFHVVNLANGADIQIEAGSSGFGSRIGDDEPPGAKVKDYIESADSNRMTIVKRVGDFADVYVLNLKSRKVETVETIHFDLNGQVRNTDINNGPLPPRFPGRSLK